MTREEEQALAKRKKKFDKREAYFVRALRLATSGVSLTASEQKLEAAANEDWEPKRIERPNGLPDWGVPPSAPPAQKGPGVG